MTKPVGEHVQERIKVKLMMIVLVLALAGCAQGHRRGQSLFDKYHEDDLDRDAGKTHEMTVFGTGF